MDAATRTLIRQRAGDRCEYCLIPQAASSLAFHVEHIVAKQHVDEDIDGLDDLALACDRCNSYKGTNLSSIDPQSKRIVPLFNPRSDNWHDHFVVSDGEVLGLTPVGRATARLLHMNADNRVNLRRTWLADNGI